MNTAVLYNPKAGKGLPAQQVMAQLSSFLAGDRILVATPELVLENGQTQLVMVPPSDGSYLGILSAQVQGLVDAGAQRFVTVGGDGTGTYLLTILHQLGYRMPILGIAAGTANVGPVVSVTLDQLTGRHISQTRLKCYDGLEVWKNGTFLSYAFNDVVIGDTFLSTVDGQMCNVSVRSLLLEGKCVPQTPSSNLIPSDFSIWKAGKRLAPQSDKIQQIIISTVANEAHYGRAIYGPLCQCDWLEQKGVIALCDHIPVSTTEQDAGITRWSTMQYLLFGPNEPVTLEHFSPEAAVICDGNPYFITGNSLNIYYGKQAVSTIIL